MPTPIDVAVNAAAGVLLVQAAWWTGLVVLALPRPRTVSETAGSRGDGLVIIVPAHNEEDGLGATLESLLAQQPTPRVLVVADNCTDATAAIARRYGVEVLERDDLTARGKGHALAYAVNWLAGSDSSPPVVAFVDADCTVTSNFSSAVARAFEDRHVQAVQVNYQPSAATSGLGRLRRFAFALLHYARPLGARRLGLPTTAKGTGMALRWDLAREVCSRPSSHITEDALLTLDCAARGVVFEYLPEPTVHGRMAQDYDDARVQDERWERGRFSLMAAALRTAAASAVRLRVRPAAAALEVAALPMSLMVLAAGALVTITAVGPGSFVLALGVAGALGGYVVIGGVAARVPHDEWLALLSAPRFMFHKLGVYAAAMRFRELEWTRARR